MHILVVEDDAELARQIASALTEAGHDPIVVHDGEKALDKTKATPFDLIVLDIILPGIDGFEVLRHLRAQHLASRVLMLTARGEVKDRVTGLQLGADDYLPKPFAMRELVARVTALGRRYPEEPVLKLRVGDLTLDLASHEVHRDYAPHSFVCARADAAKGTYAGTGSRVHTNRIMRTRMGTPARIRHQVSRGFHRAPEKKNRRSSTY